MAEVVDLADHRPHISGKAVCAACRHRWEAVAPVGTAQLECPGCGSLRGVFLHPLYPPPEELIFKCDCGSDLFMLRPAGAWCVGCGTWAKGWC